MVSANTTFCFFTRPTLLLLSHWSDWVLRLNSKRMYLCCRRLARLFPRRPFSASSTPPRGRRLSIVLHEFSIFSPFWGVLHLPRQIFSFLAQFQALLCQFFQAGCNWIRRQRVHNRGFSDNNGWFCDSGGTVHGQGPQGGFQGRGQGMGTARCKRAVLETALCVVCAGWEDGKLEVERVLPCHGKCVSGS